MMAYLLQKSGANVRLGSILLKKSAGRTQAAFRAGSAPMTPSDFNSLSVNTSIQTSPRALMRDFFNTIGREPKVNLRHDRIDRVLEE